MANKTIPQLPEQTGKTNDDLLVIVDSGETTTSKIKVSTLLDGVGGKYIAANGTNNIVPDYYPTTSINALTSEGAIVGGDGNTITSDGGYTDNVVVGGSTNNIFRSLQTGIFAGRTNTHHAGGANGLGAVIIGGVGNTCGDWRGATIGADSSNNQGRTNCVIAGGITNTITNASTYSGIIGGNGNTMTGDNSVIDGGQSNNISSNESFIGAGYNNSVTGTRSSVVGGQSNTIITSTKSVIVGGQNNSINAGNNNFIGAGAYGTIDDSKGSSIIGAWGSYIYGSPGYNEEYNSGLYNAPYCNIRQDHTTGTGDFIGGRAVIVGSHYSNIAGQTANGTFTSGIYSSQYSNITGGSSNTVIIGSSGSTASHSRSVILGGNGLSSSYNDEVVVPHLTITKQGTYNWVNGGTGGSITVDFDEGNLHTIYMSGDTDITFTNVKQGGRYSLQVINQGTFSITGATASGFTILCEGGSIPNITNNGTDLCFLEVFGSDIMIRHFANFSSPE